jgi:hypothetical protein
MGGAAIRKAFDIPGLSEYENLLDYLAEWSGGRHARNSKATNTDEWKLRRDMLDCLVQTFIFEPAVDVDLETGLRI